MDKGEYGTRPFESEEKKTIQRLLEHKLGNEHLAVRPGAGGTKVAYVESWKAIELANSIFGFDGWSSQIVDITPDFIEDVQGKFRVGVTAVVKVVLKDGTYHEDVGYGTAENKSKGSAIENAKKEAVSDARKRALRVFGNALGNCVYDKEHIKKIKHKLKGAATSSISYDKLRANSDAYESTELSEVDGVIITDDIGSMPPPSSNFQPQQAQQYPSPIASPPISNRSPIMIQQRNNTISPTNKIMSPSTTPPPTTASTMSSPNGGNVGAGSVNIPQTNNNPPSDSDLEPNLDDVEIPW
eukprot:TRINITY_DN4380_c0_g1_i2.p1 TRINITY_DN4380_c0_g1~~TRINITY_DN4380_c0_g1_i2.p1  ORF type:complete len:298 (-),score=69.88 TRINITY_DN4380_c0_g1_i2:50-943(-)